MLQPRREGGPVRRYRNKTFNLLKKSHLQPRKVCLNGVFNPSQRTKKKIIITEMCEKDGL